MRPISICCAIAVGWLSTGVESVGLAQDRPTSCQIVATQSGEMFPQGSPVTRLESFAADSYVRVECSGKVAGKYRLSLRSGSKLHNAAVTFRLVSTSGIFAPMSSEFADSAAIVPYTNDSGRATGVLRYQVRIVAANGYLLPTAPEYALKLQIESIP